MVHTSQHFISLFCLVIRKMSKSHTKFEFVDYSEKLNDSNNVDVEFVLPRESRRSSRIRKSTAGQRKVQYEWEAEEIYQLITAVEKRRGLWDINSPENRLPKLEIWANVVKELGVKDIDINEAKAKWSSLRVAFKTNLAKLRKKRSGQNTDEPILMPWRYFKPMLFLHNNESDLQELNFSTSTLDLPNEPFTSEDFLDSDSYQTIASSYELNARSRTATPTKTPLSQLPKSISDVNEAVASFQGTDSNSTFCEYLLSELRTLGDTNARTLRRLLSRTLYDFMDMKDNNSGSQMQRL